MLLMPNKATSQDAVLKSLRKMLMSGRLKAGQQIVQDTLAKRLGVSRVPLREALKVLQTEGRVIHEPNRGYFVAELNYRDLVEIYRIRTLLETEALRVGVPLATKKEIDAIARLAKEIEKIAQSHDPAAVAAANRKFHLAILELCGQDLLMRMIVNGWDFTDNYRVLYLSVEKNRARTVNEHAKIITALRAKDATKVIKLHDAHRDHAVAALKELLA